MQWILEGHTHVFSAIISSLFEIKIVYKIGGLYLYWVTYLLMLYNSVTSFCNSLSHFNENSILTSLSFNFMSVVNMTWMNDWIEIWMTEEKTGISGQKDCLFPQDTQASWGAWESQIPGVILTRLRGDAWATETTHSCPTTGNSVLSLCDFQPGIEMVRLTFRQNIPYFPYSAFLYAL